MMNDLVNCNRCHQIHFQVSKKYCLAWLDEWMGYYNTKDKDWLNAYGLDKKVPSIKDTYGICDRCGNLYKDFSDGTNGKELLGSTIGPILDRNEEL